VGVGAISILVALVVMAASLAWAAYRLDHDVDDLGAAVGGVRRVREALDQLRTDAGSTRGVIEGTGRVVDGAGRSVGLADRPAPRR
jgi:hypothetical protein